MGNPDQPRDDKGRWVSRRGGSLAAGLVLALGLASGAGFTGAGSGLGGASSASRAQGASKSNVKARDRDTGRLVLRLQRQGLRAEQRFSSDDGDCAAHSYGQVQGFFRAHPCDALFRTLFEVRDQSGNVALVAVAWVDMPDAAQARAFKLLVDRGGTGNITELSRERGRYRNERFTGDYYHSTRDDTTVVNAQAQPVGRTKTTIALAKLVAEAASS